MNRMLTSLAIGLIALTANVVAQRRAITFDDFLALPVVADPQLSPDGRTVAYTVTTYALEANRGTSRVWVTDRLTGEARPFTGGPGSDRSPRWSPDGRALAFIASRQGSPQIWVLSVAGGEARQISHLPDGVGEFLWLPDGSGFLAVSDVKWPADQEIDRRNGDYPTEARIWTDLFYRHWDEWRAGRRQHLLRVRLDDGVATDLTPVDRDVPTIATGGAGDVAIAPDGGEIAVAVRAERDGAAIARGTNTDVYLLGSAGESEAVSRVISTSPGADHTPRFSPDGKWLAYLSMERATFEADRNRLMVVPRRDGRTGGPAVEATAGWDLSVGSFAWCPDAKCVYAVVEERGRDNIYRIDIPSFRRVRAVAGGVNTGVQVAKDGRTLVYLHQSNTQPAEIWNAGKALTHHTDSIVATLDLHPLEEFGFVGARGDSVFGWTLKPPGFDGARRYPLVYLVHGGPQGAWVDNWHARWNYQMFASRGFVVAAVNFHGSTGYGQAFTDAISQHWGDVPLQDLMTGLDVVARLPYVDSTRLGAAGASYGGYMIFWLAGQTTRFRALVAHDGVFNPVSMYGSTEELWFPHWEFDGSPYDNRELFERWSPLNHVSAWKTPMLVVHGQLDYRVDLSEGLQAFTALREMGVPAKFLYFPDEGHWVLRPRNRRVWWSTVLDWLEQYLR